LKKGFFDGLFFFQVQLTSLDFIFLAK